MKKCIDFVISAVQAAAVVAFVLAIIYRTAQVLR
ncbi:hypothetical protein AWB80_07510 [Caballeronia pedi]|uniref:Uncharacterized protein n=1 Tax=Caballeronia pedi TaxID=1777141 RepID=A0A158DUS5_9BURK|nr:hypothetical protein AWB80_07510 [Caballeronia pedi]